MAIIENIAQVKRGLGELLAKYAPELVAREKRMIVNASASLLPAGLSTFFDELGRFSSKYSTDFKPFGNMDYEPCILLDATADLVLYRNLPDQLLVYEQPSLERLELARGIIRLPPVPVGGGGGRGGG